MLCKHEVVGSIPSGSTKGPDADPGICPSEVSRKILPPAVAFLRSCRDGRGSKRASRFFLGVVRRGKSCGISIHREERTYPIFPPGKSLVRSTSASALVGERDGRPDQRSQSCECLLDRGTLGYVRSNWSLQTEVPDGTSCLQADFRGKSCPARSLRGLSSGLISKKSGLRSNLCLPALHKDGGHGGASAEGCRDPARRGATIAFAIARGRRVWIGPTIGFCRSRRGYR